MRSALGHSEADVQMLEVEPDDWCRKYLTLENKAALLAQSNDPCLGNWRAGQEAMRYYKFEIQMPRVD